MLPSTAALAWRSAMRGQGTAVGMARQEATRLHINGSYAKGDFPAPRALAAMGNAPDDRVMRVLNLSGGVTCSIAEGLMERAPVFVFQSANDARAFRRWLNAHLAEIRSAAESKLSAGMLTLIESRIIENVALVRFEFGAIGDAAGDDLPAAVRAGCECIERGNPTVLRCFMTCGGARRVTAEAKIAGALLRERLGIEPRVWDNRPAVVTIAPGSTALVYSTITPRDELHLSIMIPDLSLGREDDDLLAIGCAGPGNTNKRAEIVAANALVNWLSRHCAVTARARRLAQPSSNAVP
jgi:hydroxymethylglutaryl-CoA reductase (NADPH)